MSSDPNRHRRRFLMLFFGVIFGFPLLCVVISQMIFFVIPFGSKCFSVENNAFFKLPSSAQAVEEHRLEYSASCTIWLRFRLPPDELENFVSTTLIKLPLSSTLLPRLIGGTGYMEEETNWKLEAVKSFLAGEASGTVEQPVDQIIFVDTSNSESYMVYIATLEDGI